MRLCNLCRQKMVAQKIDFGVHPIAHRLLTDRAEKEYTHSVRLGFCRSCGLTQLIDPIPPDDLYTNYHILSSWKWNPHVPRLVEIIESIPGLDKNARILEIGCNDGSFLEALHTAGYRNLHGIEPARDAYAAAVTKEGLKVDPGYFNVDYATKFVRNGACDLVVARQVLEHVENLGEFGNALKIVLREGSRVLIEVPDFSFNTRWPDYSVIWEEHVNYFTQETLAHFFELNEIVPEHMETAIFSGEIIMACGAYHRGLRARSTNPTQLESQVERYKTSWPIFHQCFLNYLKSNGRVGVYGAGCRSCSLFNFTGAGDYITAFYDDRQEKHNKYMPGSRKIIRSGNDLERENLDLCLLAVNAENEERVMAKHSGFLGVFQSIHPPSTRLPDLWKKVHEESHPEIGLPHINLSKHVAKAM